MGSFGGESGRGCGGECPGGQAQSRTGRTYGLYVPFSAFLICLACSLARVQLPYTPRSTDYGITQEPRVPVIFTNPSTGNFVLLFGLVDSGASDIILNAQFAPLLGIDLTAAPSQEYQGIGDEPFQAYKHKITIRLQAAPEAFTVPCAFMPDLRIDCILGQNGFFDTHKIG